MKQIKTSVKFLLGVIFVCVVSLSACAISKSINDIQTAQVNQSTPVLPTATDDLKVSTPVIKITQVPSETTEVRLLPKDWKKWPVIPEVTMRAREIYAQGTVLGVNAKSFSKIGDCQNIKESFMGLYDLDRYYLRPEQKEWQETIENFRGYFNRDGKAIEQGLNVAAALSAMQADPEECLPAENPVACELRIANPSFAFVSFERWWPDVTPPEQYEKYLRQVLDLIIEYGTVPILVTKADNVEGDHQINLIIATLAYEYDLPLYNWWKAAQPLPHRGLDPERNDGFHISVEAWTERSAYALGTLDTLWKGFRGY